MIDDAKRANQLPMWARCIMWASAFPDGERAWFQRQAYGTDCYASKARGETIDYCRDFLKRES